MTLIKTNKRTPQTFNGLLDSFFSEGLAHWSPAEHGKLPLVNVEENVDAFEIALQAPGFQKDQFKVELDNDRLTISGEQTHSEEEKEKNYTRKEFSVSNFSRSFVLGENVVNAEAIEATYENGILAVTLPKKEEAKPQPAKMIEIK